MWIVRLALRRPYTFVVMAALILMGGVYSLLRMPTDILPEIDIPVISIVWQYGGLPPEEMEQRFTGYYERILTTTVNGIEHIESQSLYGVSVTKVFFHPGTKMEMANAQVTGVSQTMLKFLPVGATPPLIINYSASNVPILQGSVHSDTLSEQQLYDQTNNFLRTGLATVQGAQMPFPYGGKQRQIMIDIDLPRLHALGLSPSDVNNAVQAQNLVLPAGTAKLGHQELLVRLNSSPESVRDIGALPIRTVNGSTVLISDVAQVRDGFAPQTSIVRTNGRHGVLVTLLKSAGASTVDTVQRIRGVMPSLLATLPPEYKIDLLFDQSVFVRAAIGGVVKEAAIAAGLTALMILLFLGSWRSTLIVVTSIPLSILVSCICLAALGQTVNLMTLGGLSLAVGILVDDATVELENVHRHMAMRKPLVQAILDGAQQIATPAFVATLSICVVFVPVVFISGAARSLFTPLSMAVVFAMLTSYLLSRTLVPTMVSYLLPAEVDLYVDGGKNAHAAKRSLIWRVHERFDVLFERLRRGYGGYLDWALGRRRLVVVGFLSFVMVSLAALSPRLGRDFFPAVDAGQIRFHVRAAAGTRIESTEDTFARVERIVHEVVPERELETVIDNIGLPVSGINLTLGDPSMISSADGEVLVQLTHEHHPAPEYVKELRRRFAVEMPDAEVFFLAPDITTQVLNFGVSAPIDVQVVGPMANNAKDREIAERLRDSIARVRGAVDVHLAQVVSQPELRVDVDRAEASQSGITQRDVATDALVSISSSSQVAPSFWLDGKKGLTYPVAIQTPQREIDSMDALANMPVHLPGSSTPQTLGNLASIHRDTTAVNVTHYNVLSTFDVQANVQGSDLGSVSDAIDRIVVEARKTLPRGTSIVVRGQVDSMNASFRGLSYGIVAAIALVYLLLVVNFQSWRDPLIILTALPGALAGIVWMLFATGTTLSVPALMGAIMSIGVATSNSILVIAFANERSEEGSDARRAAWLAGITRLRPVVMTALAMVLGMLPMSLGLGEGGEQNAPLARAVIGGLGVATFTTLFFVPVVYASWRSSSRATSAPRSPSMTTTIPTHDTASHDAPSHEGEIFEPRKPSRGALARAGVALALLAGAALVAGAVPRIRRAAALEHEERAAASVVPSLQVARAQREASTGPLVLPGTVRPLQETTMYARANGYVRKWYVDIGEAVKKGQPLADLDLPDVDQELRQATAAASQAKASVAQAKSQLDFARTTNARYAALLPVGLATQQQADQYASQQDVQQANVAVAEAALANADANARRVKELRAYGTIVAPFDGVITMRAAETGQLVASGTGQGQALYRVAEDDVVRVFVDVPQLYAAGIKPGTEAPVTIREAAGRVFRGSVARTSRELDTASRTLLVEVDIPNADRALVSGMYAKVSFDVKRQDAPVFVPATSVVIDAAGSRVAVVRDGGVHWQKVEIGADLGDRLALASGLDEGETVAVTPSARLGEGQRVVVASLP